MKVCALLGLVACFALAAHGGPAGMDEQLAKLLKVITQRTQALFKKFDHNGDGSVTQDEVVLLTGMNSAQAQTEGGLARDEAVFVFSKYDTNANGLLDAGEIQKLFQNVDDNNDDKVTKEEFVSHMQKTFYFQ